MKSEEGESRMNRVSIAFICDENFAMPTTVAIESLKRVKKETSAYVIYIVTTGLSEKKRQQFFDLQEKQVEIRVLDVSVDKYAAFEKTISSTKSNVSTAALLKFDLPNLLAEEDKVLYLDGDILVNTDMYELFSTELNEAYVAAVKDSSSMYTERALPVECPEYFNSGVMLLNLKQMRKENVTDRLIETKSNLKDISLMDQNTFNIVMVNRIVPMPIRYNFMYTNLYRAQGRFTFEQLNEMYNVEYSTLDEILEEVSILHFASKDKPWREVDSQKQDDWFAVFNKTSYRSRYGCDNGDIPKISVIVLQPDYVTKEQLKQTFKSLALQTRTIFETILVSENIDKSALERLIGENNVVCVTTSETRGYLSLLQGIKCAQGSYIMCIEAGDTLKYTAMNDLEAYVDEQRYDTIYYGIDIKHISGLETYTAALENGTCINPGEYTNETVLDEWLKQKNYYPVFWNQLVKKEIYNIAVKEIMMDVWKEDAFRLLFASMVNTVSNEILQLENKIYSYCINRKKFRYGYMTVEEYKEYFKIFQNETTLKKICPNELYEKSRKMLLCALLSMWLNEVKSNDKTVVFDFLWECLQERVIWELAANFSEETMKIAEILKKSNLFNQKVEKQIRTIGIYFHNLYNGGIQRVIATLAKIFVNGGYHVVIFTDEEINEKDYVVPECVERCVLPNSRLFTKDQYCLREQKFREELKRHQIDVFLDNAWNSGLLLWDVMVVKSLNIPVIAHVHNIGTLWFAENKQVGAKAEIYQLMDAAVVLSRVEEEFFSCFTKSKYIPNPCSFGCLKDIPVSKLNEKNILWLARMDERKHPEHILHAFRHIVQEIPEATLTFVGGGDEIVSANLEKMIHWYGLQDCVFVHGHTLNVEDYYKNASIFAMTSYHEGYPMTLIESKAFGVPAVVYNMPYLEVLREHKGIEIVERGNVSQLAERIIELLKDQERLENLGREARQSVEYLTDEMILSKWEEVFAKLKDFSVVSEEQYTKKFLMENIIEYHEVGINKYLLRLELENERLKISRSALLKEKVERYEIIQDLYKEKAERFQIIQDLYKEKGERWKLICDLKKDNAAIKQKKEQLEKEVKILKKSVAQLEKEKSKIKNSRSYKIANFLSKGMSKVRRILKKITDISKK